MAFSRIKNDPARERIRIPLISKIRLGIKEKSKRTGNEYPKETEYFVVPKEVQAVYGAQPKVLPVMLPVEDEEQVFRQYYSCYGSNQRMLCQGDGENAERRVDDEGKPYMDGPVQMKCPSPDNCEFGQKKKCAGQFDLMVILPDINVGGVYQIHSRSITSDIDIRSGIKMAKELFHRISLVPMLVSRRLVKIRNPQNGKMEDHWPMQLIPNATAAEVNRIREEKDRMIARQANWQLPEPIQEGHLDDTPIVEVEEVEEERQSQMPESETPAGKPDEPPAAPTQPPSSGAAQGQTQTFADPVSHPDEGEPKESYSFDQIKGFLSSAPEDRLEEVWRNCVDSVNPLSTQEKVKVRKHYEECRKRFKKS